MATTNYSSFVKQLLTEYVDARNRQYPNEYQLLFDPERQQYQVLHIGWEGSRRVYSVPLHFRLENGKIWIEQNNTDREVATELMELGVPADHIVLAFHPPSLRHLTGFATQ